MAAEKMEQMDKDLKMEKVFEMRLNFNSYMRKHSQYFKIQFYTVFILAHVSLKGEYTQNIKANNVKGKGFKLYSVCHHTFFPTHSLNFVIHRSCCK